MGSKALTAPARRLIASLLKERFPELGTDHDMPGGDAVDALGQLYADLSDTSKFVFVNQKRGKQAKPIATSERFARVTQPEAPKDASYMVTSVGTLNAAIRAVVDYNWVEELEDYTSDENDSRESHIFNSLVALDNWLEGSDNTPMSYLEASNG